MNAVLARLRAILLGGPWTPLGVIERVQAAARPKKCPTRWLRSLVRRMFLLWPEAHPPDRALLGQWLKANRSLLKSLQAMTPPPELSLTAALAPRMSPVRDRFREWRLPDLPTPLALAQWLGVTVSEIDWLTRTRRSSLGSPLPPGERVRVPASHSTRPNQHYLYRWVPRPGSPRLFEIPRLRIRQIQRTLIELFEAIPVHPAAHGFVPGRSVATALAPHVGQAVVLRIDLRHFFPSIRRGRVLALLRDAGYPRDVASRIARLVTSTVPDEVLEQAQPLCNETTLEQLRYSLCQPHLPQGSPTSPGIANRIAFRLDQRLNGLAQAAGATYTRYADDLIFSGDDRFASGLDRFREWVLAIAIDEGFFIRRSKTIVMRRGVLQSVAGLVVNEKLNVPRDEYDTLRAILHNCIRDGLQSQNRDEHPDFLAHLRGRMSYIAATNPQRGAKLRSLLARVDLLTAGQRAFPSG
jgi:RNA-directed DNA polymerase